MKRKLVLLLGGISIAILLGACLKIEKVLQPKSKPWSQSEINNLFDLSEMGKITHNDKGEWFADGRPFDFYYVQGLNNIGWGREANLLALDDKIYQLMKPQIANELYYADADTLRSELERYGLSVKEYRDFVGEDLVMSVAEFDSLVLRSHIHILAV